MISKYQKNVKNQYNQIVNGDFLLIKTETNKISKTFLWRSLCKVKQVVLLTFKVSLMDKRSFI